MSRHSQVLCTIRPPWMEEVLSLLHRGGGQREHLLGGVGDHHCTLAPDFQVQFTVLTIRIGLIDEAEAELTPIDLFFNVVRDRQQVLDRTMAEVVDTWVTVPRGHNVPSSPSRTNEYSPSASSCETTCHPART